MRFALLSTLMLASCSKQVVKKPDGTTLVNNNFLSKGRLSVKPSGEVIMAGNAEKAADRIGDYAGALLMYGALKHGVNAAVEVVDDATQ
jgi:hypothetical protein